MYSRSTLTRRSVLAGLPAAVVAAQVKLARKLRLALIGIDGHTGEITKAMPQLPDVELVAFSEPASAEAEKFVSKNVLIGRAKRYHDYRRMLESEKLDVLAVCNNNGERAAAIMAGLERKLHVIAEKPLAISRTDLERVKKAVKSQGVKLGMLLPMRYDPPYLGLKRIVDSGEIGEVVQIAAQKSYTLGDRSQWMRKRSSYGGTIPWIGIHMIDLMRFTSGREFRQAASFASRVGHPEMGDMENTTGTLFSMDNGGTATLHMDYFRPATAGSHGDDRLRLVGSKGIAEYMAATGVTLLTDKAKPRVISDLPKARSLFTEFLEHVYNGKPASLTLEDIYRNCEVTLGAQEAAERGQIVRL
jgi:predicted dehydrogenase